MAIGVLDMFKIGIGPSSSHTMGPMVAAGRFLDELEHGSWPRPAGANVHRIEACLLGSLAFTGKGHATDRAVALGLLGFLPETLNSERAEHALAKLRQTHKLPSGVKHDPDRDCVFDYDTPTDEHPNTMEFAAFDADDRLLLRRRYFSIGGGFVRGEEEGINGLISDDREQVFAYSSADELVALATSSGLSIADIALRNEGIDAGELTRRLDNILGVMNASIDRGLRAGGVLPGSLKVKRRARKLHEALQAEAASNVPSLTHANDWLSVYAMAVNEENAAGGQVVTAPTNGAAGVVPAVMRYARDHMSGIGASELRTFLLTAGAIGALIKGRASISGAEVGCQGEVGSAAAMAAAGLAAIRAGTPAQVEHAAEIALEHHLGMTCDPVAGLVQVPCIERNAFGAIKAVAAASLALRTDDHVVSLDACVETMRQTGRDMDHRYKETSLGGLAVNVTAC